jgi:glycerol-3-phosphate dehydrogenase
MQLDAVIFGGSAAGLWLLDSLARRGMSVLLLEAGNLGEGPTIASQGILHGGLKYTLQGALTRSARRTRDVREFWRNCLAGCGQPRLTKTRTRSEFSYLWRTDSFSSRKGMIGARIGLRGTAKSLIEEHRPDILVGCPGSVARIDEQVISPQSLLVDLSARHSDRILKIDAERGLSFDLPKPGRVERIVLTDPSSGAKLTLQPDNVVFAAGPENALLRRRAGLNSEITLRIPLHMVMARGDLPELNGHCVDGSRARATITTDHDSSGRTVWQIGGQIAENGEQMATPVLITHARSELEAILPGIDFRFVEWAAYRVDRAEGHTPGGQRPESIRLLEEGNTVSIGPSKLVLAPQLAEEVAARVSANRHTLHAGNPAHHDGVRRPKDWPIPRIASPPWECMADWQPAHALPDHRTFAA